MAVNPTIAKLLAQRQPTAAEQELQPYLDAERAKAERRRRWLKPVELAFDILSRGQYAAANFGQDIGRRMTGERVPLLQGVWEGIKGTRKGDWRTTLFGGQDVGGRQYAGWFPNNPDWMEREVKVPVIGPTDFEDVVGFIANVFADPINFVSFGSSTAAKASAKEFAEQSVKSAIKKLGNVDEIAKLTRKGFDLGKFKDLYEAGGERALKYVTRYGNKTDVSRILGRVYDDAYKEALRSTSTAMQARMLRQATTKQDDLIRSGAEALAKEGPEAAIKNIGTFVPRTQGLEGLMGAYEQALRGGQPLRKDASELAQSVFRSVGEYVDEAGEIASPEFVKEFAGMGQRMFRVMGKEIPVGFGPGPVARTWQTLTDSLKKTKPGQMFSDAMWSLMNNPGSIVAVWRKRFGVRNPYEKMLRYKEMELRHSFHHLADIQTVAVREIMQGVDDTTKGSVRDVINTAAAQGIEIDDVFSNPKLMEALQLDPKEVEKVKGVVNKVRGLTDSWFQDEQAVAAKGLMKEFESLDKYLPTVRQNVNPLFSRRTTPLGSYAPGFTKEKSYDLLQTEAQEASKLRWLLGLDEETALKVVKNDNWSSYNMDLEEMLIHRGLAHAQAMTNANMVEQFREFGIKFFGGGDDEALQQMLQRSGTQIDQLGLKQASHPSMEGIYFDRNVADIIDRSIAVRGSDDGLNWFGRMTAWWKGFATLSPGFHIRNDRTNRFLLFVKNGPESLMPKDTFEGIVGAVYALHGEDFFKRLKIPEGAYRKVLNRPIGGKTVAEWAMEARNSGVISKAVMGFDIQSTVKELAHPEEWYRKLNLLSNKNILFEKSHELASVVEGAPKFQSMMMDIRKMLEETGTDTATDAMSKYAQMEAKKWFFDYDDLTEFEKKFMKKIIPFYSWIRKNIALQTANMIHYKEMYAIVPKFQRMVQEEGVGVEDMPDWMRQEGYIPTDEGEDGKMRFFNPNLPYADVNKIPVQFEITPGGLPIPVLSAADLKDEILSAAHPLFKTIGALFSDPGWDPFFKRDLEPQAPAPRALRIIARSPFVLQFLDGAARLAGIDDGLNLELTDDGKLLIDGKIQFLLENNAIILKRLEQFADLPLTMFPVLEDRLSRITGVRDRYQGTERLFQTLSFWLGLKQKDYDVDKQEEYRFRDALEAAEEQRAQARRRAPGAEVRRTDYMKRQRDRMRRLGFEQP